MTKERGIILKAKTITAIILALVLSAGLLPATALAEETALPSGRMYTMELAYPLEGTDFSEALAKMSAANEVNSIDTKNTPGLLSNGEGEYATWEEAGNAAVEGVDYILSYDDGVCTVYTALGLAKIANYVNSMETSFLGWTVRLANDIDLTTAGVIGYAKDTVNETNSWNPIGTFEIEGDYATVTPFQGIFDGAGHKVQNLYMNVMSGTTGLFGSVFTDMERGGEQVVIQDITIEGADITGGFMANSFLVGFLSEAIITDCTVDETSVLTIAGGTVQMNGAFVGGAQTSGLNLGGTIYIKNCVNNGTISGGMLTGGIAGATGQRILNCTNNGDISANMKAGGIVGYFQEAGGVAPFELLDCVNNGDVSTVNGWAGGIAGQIDVSSASSLIARCYNTGAVTGGSEVGGIAGGIENGQMQDCYNIGALSGREADTGRLGGIAGYLDEGSISSCYNIGSLANGEQATTCGIVWKNSGTVESCFYLEGTAQADSGNSTEITAQQLAQQSTFTSSNWDFETVWQMNILLGRPVLQSIPEVNGSGTQDDPLIISDLETLELFRDSVNNGNSYEGLYVKLAADIDMSEKYGADIDGEEVSWTPIGAENSSFAGTFDGNGKTISGLYITSTVKSAGLFGYIGETGTVKDLTVSNAYFKETNSTKFMGGIVGSNAGTIDNCRNESDISITTPYLNRINVGGVAGVNNGIIQNSYNTGDISGSNGVPQDYGHYSGGIVGNNNGVIRNCGNSGEISGSLYIGGIAGGNDGKDAEISRCYNTGDVKGVNGESDIGGIAGQGFASISDCYNTGDVTGIGQNEFKEPSYIGGIAGQGTIVSNCYNTGAVSGNANAGSITPSAEYLEDDGYWKVTPTENSYYLSGSETEAINGAAGMTQEQFESGQVAYLLQNGRVEQVWGQTIGTDNAPVLTSGSAAKIYKASFMDDQTEYAAVYGNSGTVIVAPAENPARTGYTFSGWQGYTEGLTLDADMVFAAIWEINRGSQTYPPIITDTDNGSVSVSPRNPERGEEVTITPNPDQGYEVDEITVTDRNGDEVAITDNGDGSYSFEQPWGRVTIEITFKLAVCDGGADCPSAHLSDIAIDAWYHSAVDYVVANGLMQGTSATAFSPDETFTRGMLATILWRMEDSPVVNYLLNFNDVAEGQWYTEAIRWAASEEIVGGYGDGSFRPGDAVSREEMAAIFYRYAQHKGYDVSIGEETNILSYADAAMISEYAIPAMQWACGAGVLEGNGQLLMPQADTPRCQAAAVLMRFCENVAQ